MRFQRSAVSLLLLLSMGCATIGRGPMQRVLVETEPAGASVELEDCGVRNDERTTPVTILIPRRVKRCSMLLHHEGYEPARVILQRRKAEPVPTGAIIATELCGDALENCNSLTDVLVVATFGSLFYGVSKGVDAMAGANYELEPRHVLIPLVPEESVETAGQSDEEATPEP